MRGYFGIGIYQPKTTENMGTLWRSAHLLGASFIFTIGERYRKQPTDTMNAVGLTPLYNYPDWEDFKKHLPENSELVFIEQYESSTDLRSFIHPERAVYILGAEDKGVPEEFSRGHRKVFIKTERSLNVAVAGSIVMYARSI